MTAAEPRRGHPASSAASCGSIGIVMLDVLQDSGARRRRTRARGSRASRRRPWRPGSRSAAHPTYRARQMRDAVWTGGGTSFDDVLTLPAGLRTALAEAFRLDTVDDTEIRLADGGQTEKALHRLVDGALIESVLMHYPARGGSRERHTLCISSQAGCAVGCPFCATGELGFGRDLETAEIVDQARHAAAPAGRPMASASRTSCSWGWASRCSTSTGSSPRSRRSTTRGGSASARATSRLHLRGRARASAG